MRFYWKTASGVFAVRLSDNKPRVCVAVNKEAFISAAPTNQRLEFLRKTTRAIGGSWRT